MQDRKADSLLQRTAGPYIRTSSTSALGRRWRQHILRQRPRQAEPVNRLTLRAGDSTRGFRAISRMGFDASLGGDRFGKVPAGEHPSSS
jgi:hypothetical protein